MIFIALGANLPAANSSSPQLSCEQAAISLQNLPSLRFVALSRWYRTAPMPPSGQPSYVNGVAALEGDVDPTELLSQLQAIESAYGRQRGVRNAARTLDLDIVAIDSIVRAAPDPILPHPRMHERAFVLRPLLDVAPEWRHPVFGRTARALLDQLPPQNVRPISGEPLALARQAAAD